MQSLHKILKNIGSKDKDMIAKINGRNNEG